MCETVVEDQTGAADRVTGERTLLECLVEALYGVCRSEKDSRGVRVAAHLLASRNVIGRDVATHDLVHELDILASVLVHLHWLNKPDDTRVLPGAAGHIAVPPNHSYAAALQVHTMLDRGREYAHRPRLPQRCVCAEGLRRVSFEDV